MAYNPKLAGLMKEAMELLEKRAYTPMTAQGVTPSPEEQAAQQQQQPPQGGPPQDPAQAQPQAPPQQPAGIDPNTLKNMLTDAVREGQEKPKKPSTDERITNLEDLVTRMLEYLGLAPQSDVSAPSNQEQPPEQGQPTVMGAGISGQAVDPAQAGNGLDQALAGSNVLQGMPGGPAQQPQGSKAASSALEAFRQSRGGR